MIRRALMIAAVGLGFGTAAGAARAAPLITPDGVGPLNLGSSVTRLQREHLVGDTRRGCELDPGQRVAPLRAPLHGWAIFDARRRRLSAITIDGGRAETVRHISVGSDLSKARAAYPHAFYESPGSAAPFVEGFLWIPTLERPRMTIVVGPRSRTVESISIPAPSFCE